MDKHFTFDDMINTMMPLPISGAANGEGIYCRGQELVASMGQLKERPVRKRKPPLRPSRHLLSVLRRLIKKPVVSG